MSDKSLIGQLTTFLKTTMPSEVFRGQKFTSFTDNMELKRQFKQVSPEQLQAGIITYDAVLSFDDFPYRKINPQLLFLLVNVWIEQLLDDETFTVEDNPEIDTDVIDEQLADITISLKMTENLYMIEDEKGEIPFNNKRYRIDRPIIWYNPENIEVIPTNGN